ncbi:SMP-30/gluconolactonase/LRE family protein [Arenibacter certesii]|uniref:Regucalcin n=1 Tax=Arenibacter certesii TaxID=228955 RepID=A0A918ITJ5_9FLAO|nr:SMP-30/gluconolactonase/LRE family protein [Arenibacter certesii]GGW27493.1 regucalcin-like protein [Arenibacter certesii]
MKSVEVVCDHISELGEGPIWDEARGLICWVDILNGHIHEWATENKTMNTINVGQMIGAMAVTADGNYVAAVHNGFVFIDRKTGTLNVIANPEEHLPENRFNDGKCDPAGRFWAGTMPLSEDKPSGSLYVLNKDRSIEKRENNVTISNGLAWDLKEKAFYYIDTPTLEVVQYNYEMATGAIADKRTIIRIPKEAGFPDGMTIDSEGMLWIAHWGGWQVTRWNPKTGKQLTSFKLPVSNITSCTFGGEKLNDLYITSARKGLNNEKLMQQPLAGSLFVIRNCGYVGVAANKFMG